jgi:hypothetical protein
MRAFAAALPLIFVLVYPASFFAQSSQLSSSPPSSSMPRLINFSGVFQPVDGQPPAPTEVVTVSIYAEPQDGVP